MNRTSSATPHAYPSNRQIFIQVITEYVLINHLIGLRTWENGEGIILLV